jgi:hypothetical protein
MDSETAVSGNESTVDIGTSISGIIGGTITFLMVFCIGLFIRLFKKRLDKKSV